MAKEQSRSFQECLRTNTSGDFVDWVADTNEEWNFHSKADYYMAQIAAEIRAIRESFSKNPKGVSVRDCLITFTAEPSDPSADPLPSVAGRKEIEVGSQEAVVDPKWSEVTKRAKAAWGVRLGIKEAS